MTVEYVLPQWPGDGSSWLADFTDEERELWTHRIANLVLLTNRKNFEAQNFAFAEEKRRYFANKNGVTTFALTTYVLGRDEWAPSCQRRGSAS